MAEANANNIIHSKFAVVGSGRVAIITEYLAAGPKYPLSPLHFKCRHVIILTIGAVMRRLPQAVQKTNREGLKAERKQKVYEAGI